MFLELQHLTTSLFGKV